MIARCKCLRGKAPKIRQFYLRSLGWAYQIENFTELHNFLRSVLVIALGEEIGLDESGALTSSEIHLRDVNNAIKGIIIDDSEKDTFHYDDEDTGQKDWLTWTKNVFLDAKKISCNSQNGNVVNAHYNPEAAKKIKSLMNYLPLWIGIMRLHFKYDTRIATSSFVEAEFSELRTRVLKNQLPMRIDKFVIRHLEHLEGRLLLTAGTFDKKTPSRQNSYIDPTSNRRLKLTSIYHLHLI
ncbi:unnamed protein product [Lasius platythorax]|uniref:Uncharacterized protein n=1 Tax=Lasius platythorax TaxID=488582 RepID=A0AAV2MZW7_9HYME